MADYMTKHAEFMAAIRDNASYQESIADAIRAGADVRIDDKNGRVGTNRAYLSVQGELDSFGPLGIVFATDPLQQILQRHGDFVASQVAVYAAIETVFNGTIQTPTAGVVKLGRFHYIISQDLSLRNAHRLEEATDDEMKQVGWNSRMWKDHYDCVMRRDDGQLFAIDMKNIESPGQELAKPYVPQVLENIVELK